MTTVQAEKIARRKLSLLQLAQELGNVSKACRIVGYSRQHAFFNLRCSAFVRAVAHSLSASRFFGRICSIVGMSLGRSPDKSRSYSTNRKRQIPALAMGKFAHLMPQTLKQWGL